MSGRQLGHGDHIGREELIEITQNQPALQNSPGSEWNYNNTAFGLAAVIVERTSGQGFHEFMADNVFGPLGMTRTVVRPTPEHIVEGRSIGYAPSGDGFLETQRSRWCRRCWRHLLHGRGFANLGGELC